MEVLQGRLESRVRTTAAYRCLPLFYKSWSPESLSDHYYHTNRQIYLTSLVLSHNTYSLVLLLELEGNASPPHHPNPLPFPFFFVPEKRLWVDKGSEQ